MLVITDLMLLTSVIYFFCMLLHVRHEIRRHFCCQRHDAENNNTWAVGRQKYAPPLSSPCGRRSASRRRGDGNVAVGFHAQYLPTLTAAAA